MNLPTMAAAKSIDELFEEVRSAGCDLVVTNDAPLATALNTRIDMPQIGPFAYTARQIAGLLQYKILGRTVLSDVEIVRRIQETLAEEGKIWAFSEVYNEVLNIREIRRYTSRVEEYLHGREKAVYSVFSTLETREALQNRCDDRIMEEFYRGKRVAVIDAENFDQLDRHMLPPIGKYVEIDPFKKGARCSIDKIYAVGNDRQVAESVVDLIEPSGAADTAVVLDSAGPIADAIRAALYRRSVPFKNKLSVRDVPAIRDYLQFLNLALSFDTLRVSDVRTMLQSFGANGYRGLRTKFDNNLLKNILSSGLLGKDFDERSSALISLMGDVRSKTFEEVRQTLDRRGSTSSVAIQLESMGLSGHRVNEKEVGDLSYAITNIQDLRHNEQIPEHEKKGVLLADCKNSVYIDRPFVIFVGLSDDWNTAAPGKPYIDYEELDEYNAKRMSVLLQQGQSRIYAVKPYTDGKDTVPCGTLDSVFGTKIAGFRDICGEDGIVRGSWAGEPGRQNGIVGDTDKDLGIPDGDLPALTFSQSSYRCWRQCPISFMFRRALPFSSSEDNGNTVYGNLIHEFAETAFSYPEEFLAHKDEPEIYVDKLMSLYAPISDPSRWDIDRTRFLTHVKKILRFVGMVYADEHPPLTYRGPEEGEVLRFLPEGKEGISGFAETTEEIDAPPMKAKYDVAFGNRIYDFKTGEVKTVSRVVNSLRLDDPKTIDTLDVQALFYLYVRAKIHGSMADDTVFTLFFLNKDEKNSREFLGNPEYDIRKDLVNIRYEPDIENAAVRSAVNYIETTPSLTAFGKAIERDRQRLLDVLHGIFAAKMPNNEETARSLLRNLGIAEGKTNLGHSGKVLKWLLQTATVIVDGNNASVSRETLDAFASEVAEDTVRARRRLTVPFYDNIRGGRTCARCEYRRLCVMASDLEVPEGGELDGRP